MKYVTKAMVKKLYPKRKPWCHKGDFGKLLIIGGSKMYSGSPGFSALAAISSGVDLVTIAAPERAANIIAGWGPDLITWPLKGDCLNPWHLKDLLNLAEKNTAVVIGGGVGHSPQTMSLVTKFLQKNTLPCVIDADGLHTKLALNPNTILTPHTREFELISGALPSTNLKIRADQISQLAGELKTTILLKGHVDIISNGKETFANRTGCPYLTKGGTGDTLAGIAGALLARGAKPIQAACASAWINGRAGELAARELGESLMALDLVEKIAPVLRTF